MIFECIFDRFEVQVLHSGLADLEKHQTLAFLLMIDFLRIFKITPFLSFLKMVENHQKHMLNMVAQTQ